MEEVTEELCNVAQFIRLQPVDGIVLRRKRNLKCSLPPLVEQAEPPTDQAVVTQKRSFLGAAFHIQGGCPSWQVCVCIPRRWQRTLLLGIWYDGGGQGQFRSSPQ